ncbi:hypothetical protein [Solirubrobacter soli]|uniref:hypothetical protein n=1 Tax=Solirubrobacter soli TaxID=363832 RepID=UPI0012F8E4AF|nr:hypothetical protein [Solirubrobacter soli]
MREEHVLERQREQLPQRGEDASLVQRRVPHAQLAVRRGQRIGEHERALLGQVDRRLHHPAAVVERLQSARELVAGADLLELGLRDVVAPEQHGPERADAVPAHEQVDVADVVGLETIAVSGAKASMRSHTARADGGGASGSSRIRRPPEATATLVTCGSQSDWPFQSGCGIRQNHSPSTTSCTCTGDSFMRTRGTRLGVRLHYTGLLVFATATLGLSAPTAQADTQYGGTGLYKGNIPAAPSISLVRRDNGQVAARVLLSARCRGYANYNMVIKVAGSTPDGASFTAAGKAKLGRPGSVRVTLSGTLAPDSVSGSARVRFPGCKGYTQPFVLRTESAPAGAPAIPAPGTLMQGFTSQTAAGLRLPVSLRVAKNGRVYALWQAVMRCGRAAIALGDYTPSRKVHPDGTFGGSQSYVLRYRGYSEHYRVTFKGQFRADGVTGTLRARVYYKEEGRRRSVNCVSGTRTWSARP